MADNFNSNIFELQHKVNFDSLGREINEPQVVYYDANGNIAYADRSQGFHIGRKTIGMCKDSEAAQSLCNSMVNHNEKQK